MFNSYSKELLCGAKKVNMSKVGNDIWKMMQHENRGDFMYECPITTYIDEAINAINQEIVEQENEIIYKISESIGVDINKRELIKALNYDRHQYEKGYADAKAEYMEKIDKIKAEIFNACSDNYHMPVNTLSLDEIFEVINKYTAESEDK